VNKDDHYSLLCYSGRRCCGRDVDDRSTQCLYISAGANQRPSRHALVQHHYGNTTATLLAADDTAKYPTLPSTHQQRGRRAVILTRQRTAAAAAAAGDDSRLLRTQLVASADCIYCRRYGSVDASRQTTTTPDPAAAAVAAAAGVCRRASDADVSTESLQHSPITT